MVPPQHPSSCSAEPRMMKEMSAGDEASSAKALLEKRCIEFINSLRNFPWFGEYKNLMKEYKTNEIDSPTMLEKVVQLFQGHPELIVGFNQFLPEKHQITLPEVVGQKRKRRDGDSDGGVDARPEDSKVRRVIIKCEKKTEERFQQEDMESDDGHHDFLGHKAPTLSPMPRITVPKNKSESDGDSTSDSDEAESTNTKFEKVYAFVNKVGERFRNNRGVVVLFLDMICKMRNRSSPNRSINSDDEELLLYKKVATVLEGEQDLIDELTQLLTRVPRMDEIFNFHECEKITPSYIQLPKNFPIPSATRRSKIASEVLNNSLICVDTGPSTSTSTCSTSRGGGGGGGGRRVYQKSQYELDLLDWEEEMSEQKVAELYVESASVNIKELMREIENQSPTKKICIEERLGPRTLRCIEGLYGEQGLEMIDALKNNPKLCLPVIYKRLRKKLTELKDRSDLKEKWAHLLPNQKH